MFTQKQTLYTNLWRNYTHAAQVISTTGLLFAPGSLFYVIAIILPRGESKATWLDGMVFAVTFGTFFLIGTLTAVLKSGPLRRRAIQEKGRQSDSDFFKDIAKNTLEIPGNARQTIVLIRESLAKCYGVDPSLISSADNAKSLDLLAGYFPPITIEYLESICHVFDISPRSLPVGFREDFARCIGGKARDVKGLVQISLNIFLKYPQILGN